MKLFRNDFHAQQTREGRKKKKSKQRLIFQQRCQNSAGTIPECLGNFHTEIEPILFTVYIGCADQMNCEISKRETTWAAHARNHKYESKITQFFCTLQSFLTHFQGARGRAQTFVSKSKIDISFVTRVNYRVSRLYVRRAIPVEHKKVSLNQSCHKSKTFGAYPS